MPHRQPKCETQRNAGLLGAVIALFRELFEKPIATGDADLSQGEVIEGWHHQGPHIPLVELPGPFGKPLFQIQVFKLVGVQIGERTVWCQP